MTRSVVCAIIVVTIGTMRLHGMDDPKPAYPPSKVDSISEKLHGVEIADPYRWLEDGENPAVREWTEKQNALTRQFLDEIPGRARIRYLLDNLLQIPTLGVPHPARGKYFHTKREGKQNQPVLYVRDGLTGTDRVLLDVNALAADGTTALDWFFNSLDGRLVAYGLSPGGSERSTLRIRDVASGKDLPDVIEGTRACSLAWLPDSSGFYYTRYPTAGSVPAGDEVYHRRVFLHKLGDDPKNDTLVFGEGRSKEEWPNVHLSANGKWLVVVAQQGWAKSELFLADAKTAPLSFKPLVEKIDANFDVDLTDTAIYVRTNEGAPRYKLYAVDPTKTDRKDWRIIIPEGVDVLEKVNVVDTRIVTVFMQRAASRMRLYDLDGTFLNDVQMPTIGTVTAVNSEPNGKEFFFGFQSFTTPTVIVACTVPNFKGSIWNKVTTDIKFENYEVQQVGLKSKDGTPISMFIASKKNMPRNGRNPTILYGYGGFNQSLTPAFSAARFVFLERGGVLAIANLRGGGEYGEAWHRDGMLDKKQNVFDDFISAAEWLINEKITSPDRLAIQGGSNGGLLVGAALTQRPELFRAVVCQVPLLDMIRYHKFQIARLWIPEYGSADDPKQFRWLMGYSPYHKIKQGVAYPAVLLTAAESDTRVDPLHARKMAARLQAASGSSNPVLVRLETKAGHGAGKPRSKQLDELTDIYAFIFSQLGVTP